MLRLSLLEARHWVAAMLFSGRVEVAVVFWIVEEVLASKTFAATLMSKRAREVFVSERTDVQNR